MGVKVNVITSSHNALVKWVTALKMKKNRDESGLFILEGAKFVSAVPPDAGVFRLVVAERFLPQFEAERFAPDAPLAVVADRLFDKMADTVTPQGILAVCAKRTVKVGDLLKKTGLVVFCESIGDPGNAGTIIRAAAAAGCAGVVFSKGSADIYSPKTLRATAGNFFKVPVVAEADTNETLKTLSAAGFALLAAQLDGDDPYNADMTGKCCLLIGSEAAGLSPEASARADVRVRLPMAEGVESLNASAAAAILMYEAVRQRILKANI